MFYIGTYCINHTDVHMEMTDILTNTFNSEIMKKYSDHKHKIKNKETSHKHNNYITSV